MMHRMGPPGRKVGTKPPHRPVPSRAQTATPTLNGRVSPAESLTSNGLISRSRSPTVSPRSGLKRKERDFDHDTVAHETNINVVVRCRGRSDREVKENSGVVVSTDGVKGNAVELSMGASALSNKTYNFDRVFSPAADQGMVFEEVVKPILDQTGTGKTYTMSGDITDLLPLPDEAGIIPRVLHALFQKLEDESESTVKCSFIELYNEELKDLLAPDDAVKLKLFDDANRKSHGATLVQGMEETHIKSASKGLELLRIGSHKRQVAATKCNDLSSRSHTVFTITTYIKRTSENGEEVVTSGKLNLVDLAGSENIQRSGAENKRAAEAGLINKSLLTLGRVINALVDKNSHIPYRESKLTRLLQDSLGGRTKTCIIATLSPAKSNLEETISTLDYAFRAKNIRNKPQANQLLPKKTLLREFTLEIEKLKAELIATRQRNGVYLTAGTYEEMTTESESRRILSEEQRDKIETMEANLRNKAQELFTLTSNLNLLKKDHETTRSALEGTQSTLEKTEIVLNHTRQSLAEEEMLRQAHAASEDQLASLGKDLISTLGKTTTDIEELRAKHKRRSDLQVLNRTNWTASRDRVAGVATGVEGKVQYVQEHHSQLLSLLSQRLNQFVKDELTKLDESKGFLHEKGAAFEKAEGEVNDQTLKARDQMNGVLEGIKTLRGDLKHHVGEGLEGLSAAAKRISGGVIVELEGFHTQLHQSYSALGKDLKSTFDDLLQNLSAQQTEAIKLRQQLSAAGAALVKANEEHDTRMQSAIDEEKAQAADDRQDLLAQVTSLIQGHGNKQDARFDALIRSQQQHMASSNEAFVAERERHDQAMDEWMSKETQIRDGLQNSRELVKQRIKSDWANANDNTTKISETTRSVHEETIRIVDAQMANMDEQLSALDEIVSRVRSQNSSHHDAHVQSLARLGSTVKQSYTSIVDHMNESADRTQAFSEDVSTHAINLDVAVKTLDADVRQPVSDLKAEIEATALTEYAPTGVTPQKASYDYPTSLPRTQTHEKLLAQFRGQPLPESPRKSPRKRVPLDVPDLGDAEDLTIPPPISPSKVEIFADATEPLPVLAPISQTTSSDDVLRSESSTSSNIERTLREADKNVAGVEANITLSRSSRKDNAKGPPGLKRANTGDKMFSQSVGPGSKPPKKAMAAVAEGRENQPLAASVGAGRVLRARRS
ncbi:MAG: hypothetical protein Q9159_005140 [Coniocarpon cinnabarinum]